MKKQTWIILGVTIVVLLLVGGGGGLLAGPPDQGGINASDTVRSGFSYQGRLTDKLGNPLDGQYNMVFQLWDALTGGSQVGSDIAVNNVDVDNGLFNVILDVSHSDFNGQGLWIRTKVGDEWLTPRQEILPVPYAMSLVPGAKVVGDQSGSVLRVENSGTGIWARATAPDQCAIFGYAAATTGWSVGVAGDTYSSEGAGVVATNFATTGGGYGVWGNTMSPDGIGVYGQSDVGGNGVQGWTTGGSDTNYAAGVWGGTDTMYNVGVAGWHSGVGTAIVGESVGGTGIAARSTSWRPIEAFGSSWDDVEFYVSNDGNVYADGTFHTPAADFAEMLPAQAGLEPGDVLVIGTDGKLTRCTQVYQTAVVGVYSTQPGFLGGAGDDADLTGKVPLAIVGVAPVKVSSENGPIVPGSLLTPSATAGHAMVCNERLHCIGAIIGKALESLDEGTGVIKVLVTLQ